VITDLVTIFCKAGHGGEGCACNMMLSPRRIIGGGGPGGKGGDVILKVSHHPSDLSRYHNYTKFIADDGKRGDYNNRHGCSGKDLILEVPKGTIVAEETGEVLCDLCEDDQQFTVVYGGKGGEGNFKKFYKLPPDDGVGKNIILDYRIPCDVAILGFPNNGKTALFNQLTGKNFKVADYPFTTRSCVWAHAEHNYHLFMMMDNPPLKASEGQESDDNNWFIKHIMRAKVYLFVSDNPKTYKQEFAAIKSEIELFDEDLMEDKKIIQVLTKADTFKTLPKAKNLFCVSNTKNTGIKALKDALLAAVKP
jgi:GTP-binding protein